ncbi:MAG TPA: hypothetical protein VEB22_14120 [Phycisphaerales bacterium]|nr:hypothetical protein [Phycisphaerales bacterium]
MKRGVRRSWWWAWRTGAATLLGVATTLALAYGGAALSSETDFVGLGDANLDVLREGNAWWDIAHIASGLPDIETVRRIRAISNWSPDLDPVVGDDVAIDPVAQKLVDGGTPCDLYLIGWPARCLWGIDARLEHVQVGLEPVPEWLEEIRFVHHPFPTRIWWPGMLANVAVFGGGWLALLAGPGVTRWWLRRQRGGCPECGYDVKGLQPGAACPECGAATSRVYPQ